MKTKITPMMQQWHDCKKKSKEALLLFRLGDFYEAFYDDAKLLAKDLELTLTKRGDIPMSGIPAHTAENYIEKLINKGHLVAIAEQTEDPKDVKGIVKREVVRLLSPGCVQSPNLLQDKSNNFFAALYVEKHGYGLSFLDLTTGVFKCAEFVEKKDLLDELTKIRPKELLVPEKLAKSSPSDFEEIKELTSSRLCIKDNYHYDLEFSNTFLKEHFKVLSLDGFGLKDKPFSVMASGALLSHLKEELSQNVDHITKLELFQSKSFMAIDRVSQRNLEVLHSEHGNSLFDLVDNTSTPMGARLLKMWLSHPLLCEKAISHRLSCTEELLNDPAFEDLSSSLKEIRDLERLITRIATGYHSPRDIWALMLSLKPIPNIKSHVKQLEHPSFQEINYHLQDLSSLTSLIDKTLIDNPPLKVASGELIKKGVDEKLDHLKTLKENAQNFLLQYQEKLRKETGIRTLKVGFNKAFGYFIEVSRGQSKNVPLSFHKRQTLVNNERYITEELRQFENEILNAEQHIAELEQKIYQDLKLEILKYATSIRQIAKAIAQVDCLTSSARLASNSGYTKPLIDNSSVISIKDGRHPVVELSDPHLTFVPNDTHLNDQERLFLITGPNMAGKSTYIRQVALLVIMAQAGLYVPASSAHIGIVDKVFTRIGASDDLSKGQSTFMVEMTETANILNNATSKSLVILDEIGRGTSTYDGISIAWSVAKYLLTNPQRKAKTLFATHYFELTEMEGKIPGAVNYNISVKETDQGIVFLRKIQRGQADKSYGIHVAKLAGLPPYVISKAEEMLKKLEKKAATPTEQVPSKKAKQLTFFENSQEDKKTKDFFNSLKEVDLNSLSPLQAFDLVRNWLSNI